MPDKKEVFKVKERTAYEFMKKYVLGFQSKGIPEDRNKRRSDQSCHHLLTDSILIKNDLDLSVGDRVDFELVDQARHTETVLTNHYEYVVEAFDDVALNMVLKEFKVTVSESKA